MKEIFEDYGFYVQLIIASVCWVYMAIYLYDRIKNIKK